MSKPRPVYRTWLKFYSERYLIGGSTRTELEPDERSVWLDVLCLANRRDGCFEVFSRDHLAQQLRISRELMDRSIAKFLEYKKIKKQSAKGHKSELFIVSNWEQYQYGEGERIAKRAKRESPKTPKGEKSESTRLDRIGLDRTGQDKDEERIKTGLDGQDKARPTEGKLAFFELLKSVSSPSGPSYPFDEGLDGQLYELFAAKYPAVNIMVETTKKIAYWQKEPAALRAKKSPREQLIKWLVGEADFQNRKGGE